MFVSHLSSAIQPFGGSRLQRFASSRRPAKPGGLPEMPVASPAVSNFYF
ncbi:MAG: hypothetical protein LBC80_05505 [Treponema sp.]|nr:hypothetical protein [Treponema sp.]